VSDLTPSNDIGLVVRATLRAEVFPWPYDADGVYVYEEWIKVIDRQMPGGFVAYLTDPTEMYLPFMWADIWEPIINFS